MGLHLLYEENKESRREISLIKKSLKEYANVMTDGQKKDAQEEIERLQSCIKYNEHHINKWGD